MKVKNLFSSGVSYNKRKHPFLLILLIFVLFLLSSVSYGSSDIPPGKLTDGQKVFVRGNPGLHVEWNANEGVPYSIRGLSRTVQGDRVKAIINYLNEIKAIFKITEAASEMTFKKVDKDDLGFEHHRFHQVYRGIKVANGEIIVQVNDRSQITQINGQYYPEISIPLNTSLTGYDALSKVVKDFEGKPNFRVEKEPELVIYPQGLSNYRLAYHYILYYDDQAGDVGRWVFYVDANTGAIINCYDDIQYIRAVEGASVTDKASYPKSFSTPASKNSRTNYSLVSSITAPTSNGLPFNITGSILTGEGGNNTTIQGWYESTNDSYYLYNYDLWWYIKNLSTSSSYSDANTYAYRAASPDWGTTDRTEMSAAQNMKIVQDYFKTIHGRNSFDNLSTPVRVNVHYGTNYVNGYWNGTDITIGDGDGVQANSLAVLDVMGHEFAHAWTEHTSNLTYQGESGALNESFSDIMGANIEFYAQADGRSNYPGKTAGKADWLVGEDCWLTSTALRDMRNPGSTSTLGYGSQQPSRYHGQYWYDGSEAQDHGGVHYNGGPQSFVYYLLSDGGSGTNDGLSYSVTGIGINNARLVAYRTNSYKLTSSSGYAAARAAWVSAASDINAAWVNNVKAAWDAIGIIDVPATVTESFEGSSLPTGWTTGGNASWSIVSDSAKHGSKSLKSGAIQNNQSTWIQKTITPSSAGNVSFFVKISSEMGYDKLEFYVDGVKKTTWSGEVPWTSYVTYLSAGSHTLKWQYVKDPDMSSGSDAAWIDALTYADGGTSCTYTISPTSANIIAAGGTGTVNVTSQSGCSWTAVSISSWITVTSGSSGSATGSVGYSVASNTTAQRSGTITIAGQTFTITQDAGNGQPGGIGDAVDNTSLTWTTTGSATWYAETTISYYGGSAAQSGAIGNNQTTSVQTTVAGPAQVSFYWKVSSEANYDFLKFYIDGAVQTSISGNVDWQQQTYALLSGSHTLKWEYSKDPSVSSGSDAGWIDKVVVSTQDIYTLTVSKIGAGSGTVTSSPSGINCGSTCSASYASGIIVTLTAAASSDSSFAGWSGGGCSGTGTCTVAMNSSQTVTATFTLTNPATIGNAVDNTSLTWTTGGNANWYYQTITSYYAGNAARSGAIDNGRSTWVQTTITGPGQVSFYWMVSSEVNYDYLKFFINGVLQKSISGEVNWQRETFTLLSGTNTLKWEYAKDQASAVGQDAGWLDKVAFCAQELCSASPVNISTNSMGSRNTIKITDLSGSRSAAGGAVTVSAWDVYGNRLVESESAAPLLLYNNRTTNIAGSDLAARFPAGEPSTYEFSIYSPALIITNVKSNADGTLNVPMVYTRGVVNYHYASNSIGTRNTLKITDMTGTLPAAGGAITVSAWDASGNAIPESSNAVPLKIYSRRTTPITGSELAARFLTGSPMTYEFSIGSSKVLVTNVKSSSDGIINIPTVYSIGLTNFATNYVSSRNTIKITDLSGSVLARAYIRVTAWDAAGNAIPQSGSLSPLKLYNLGTTTIAGSDLAERFPSGSPSLYEFSIDSTKVVITNSMSSSDGTISVPSIYTSGVDGGI